MYTSDKNRTAKTLLRVGLFLMAVAFIGEGIVTIINAARVSQHRYKEVTQSVTEF